MSVSWMSAVWTNSEAKGTTRLVLLALADNARDEDGVAWPSVATLARKTRVDERTVQRAINQLSDAATCERCLGRTKQAPHERDYHLGEITVEQQGGRTNRYRLLLPRRGDNLTPRQSVTPGEMSPTPGNVTPHPRQAATPTPGRLPPKPLGNRQGTVTEPRRRRFADDSQWTDVPTGPIAI